jgi:hypothetical protein
MEQVLALPYVNIYRHPGPAYPAIEMQWLSFVSSPDFRAAAAQALARAQQHQAQGWVADDRLLGAVRPRDLEWVRHEILLPLSALGLRRFALLESQDVLNRYTIDRMYDDPALQAVGFELGRFTNIDEARAWAQGTQSILS